MDVGREPGNLIQMDHLPDDAHLNEPPFIPPRIITGRGGGQPIFKYCGKEVCPTFWLLP